MTHDERAFLRRLCSHLQERFPSLMAAHDGFATPYLGGERDGFLVVEVFNVPEEQMEEVLREGEALAFEHLMSGGGFVTFSLWTPEETREHFSVDVEALQRSKLASEGWLETVTGAAASYYKAAGRSVTLQEFWSYATEDSSSWEEQSVSEMKDAGQSAADMQLAKAA